MRLVFLSTSFVFSGGFLQSYLGHLFTVGLGVQGSLGKEDGVLFGGNTELVVEGVMPDLQRKIRQRFAWRF